MPRADYDFWLFDLDGTLVDIERSYPRTVMGAVGDRLGVDVSDREADRLWYGMGGVRDRTLAAKGVDPEDFWTAFHEVEDPRERAEATYLYDDAEWVGEVDGPVGVVTHCQRHLTDPVLDRLDIRDWFDTVVCCTEETGWKPDPEPVHRAMGALAVGGNGHRGTLVGDDADDVGAAWNAGLDAVHVERRDPDEWGQCVLGDRRVTSLRDL